MADDCENYIFENKRETSDDFALANGDVISVLKGLRFNSTAPVSFRRRGRGSYFPNASAANRVRFDVNALSVSRPSGGASVVSSAALNSVLFPGAKTASASGMFPVFSVSGGSNTSNGEDLILKAQETPVFSGLFGKRGEFSPDRKAPASAGGTADNLAVAREVSGAARNVFSPVGEIVLSAGTQEPGDTTENAPQSVRRTVRRNLTFSAEDMSGFRSYQVGGTPGESDVSGTGSGTVVNHSGKASGNDFLSPSGGEGSISKPADGCIVIDDPVSYVGGWIGIPERPIGGWIDLPERPIGGWIIEPYPYSFEEYDIFEDYGVDLSCDWTEYTDSDFSIVELEFGSKLSFSVKATNAATFTIYQSVQDGNGGYLLKALQTTELVFDKESGNYVAATQALLLEAGQYCLCVQSADPVREGDPAASYQFELDHENSDMFVDGDNSDDWTDLRTEGEFGEVAYAGVLDEYSFDLFSDWVGFGDAVDYAGFTLDSAAKLSFTIDSTDAVKFTLYRLVQDKNGKYSLKTLQTTTLSYDKEFEEYAANTKALLLEAGEYYFSVQSTNAAQGGSAYYDIYLNTDDGATEFFTAGDDSDDWTDLAVNGASGQVDDIGVIDENSFDLCENWVGYGDEFDYAKFTLNSAAKLSFTIDSTGAAKFTIYQLLRDRNGKYSLKTLQTTTLTYDTDFEEYAANTKALLLEAGEYYFSVQSTNAAQGGSAEYTVYLNQDEDGSSFFLDGNNSDDWTDLAEAGGDGAVDDIGVLNESCFEVRRDWVGFGDAVDYAKFTLDSAAKLSFSVMADDATKFTIYRLLRDKNGKYSLKALQTTTLSYDREFEEYAANTKALLLEAGEYYFSVQSTNAAQGGSADYVVSLNQDEGGSVFFPQGSDSDDWTDLRTEGADGSVAYLGFVDGYTVDLCSDWVGFGDAVDYMGFTLDDAANLSFSLSADGAVKFTVYQLLRDKNGTYSLKALQTTSLSYDKEYEYYAATTKALYLAKGDYYISVQSADAAQGGGAYYNVSIDGENSRFFTADDCGDWSDLETLGPDGTVGDLGVVDESTAELTCGQVGGKETDYARITLFSAAKLSFTVNADNAAKFTVYQLVQDKNGKYSLKALQTTSLAINRQTQEYDAATKALLLEAGEYYISVSPAAADGVGYSIGINADGSTFYTEGNSWDDWTDLKTAGASGEVGYVGALDDFEGELVSDWVGFGDAVDYMGFYLGSAASVRFTINAGDAVTFTVYSLSQTKGGMYKLNPLQTTVLAPDSASGGYEAVTKALLLEAGEFYFSVQSTNAAQGGDAHYTVNIKPSDCTFYTQGCNSDDWTDLQTEGGFGEVGSVGVIDESSTDLLTDWVGFGDAVDYMGFTLFNAAKLSFLIDADGAAAFTVYRLVQDKNGMYSLETLQTTALTPDKASGDYGAATKALLLEAGEYYFSVQSTDAAQGGGANYSVSLNGADSRFYAEGDNNDDWTALAEDGMCGDVGDIGVIDAYSTELVSGWVGFGDAVDYMGFTLFNAAKLSFLIDADGAAAFSVYRLVQDKNGTYSLKTLQTTTLSLDKASGDYEAATKALLLEAGEYYFSVQSVDAAQGGSASYTLNLNAENSHFYTDCDNSDDWTDIGTAGEYGMVGSIGVVDGHSSELANGWVGFGDEFDYASFSLYDDAELSFTLEATDAATFTVYSLVEAGNGTCKLKTLQSSTLVFDALTGKYAVTTKALNLEAGDYYFSMQSTNAAQGGGAYYDLKLNESGSTFFPDESAEDENWSAIEYEPDPICGGDTGIPIEWVWTCAYPACDEPVAVVPSAGTPVDDVLAYSDTPAVTNGASVGLAVSELSGNKQTDALKDLSSLA